MKKVLAIIREGQLDPVIERLIMIGVRGLTITPVRGAGRSGGHNAVFRGGAYRVTFVPKIMLEWYGPDDEADAIVRAIVLRAGTGKIGDGKIFVEPVEEALRIRTGERGRNAV
jgi:nitrogen regulatory protein P-II 1